MKRILSLFLIIVLGCFLLSGCKKAITVDELLSKGKYEKAYKKATGDRKEEVLKENLMAYLCKDLILEGEDNPSLKIKDCYYINI